MYLSDRELTALLQELDVQTDDPNHPFVADEQIQPCSIDLRLSNVFWQPSRRARFLRQLLGRRRPLDLRRSHLEELAPRRDWKRVELAEGESITLRPKQILLGRIYEQLTVPAGYAGKIEGRSSFSRLGLAVHCTGDFINPGWGGYMPLQLHNSGPFSIRIYPFLPICQLMVIKLTSEPTRTYGDDELQSKYVNDDGGPSYWWRDRRVARLQERLSRANLSIQIVRAIVDLVRFQDPDLLEHFERFVERQRAGKLESADVILDSFARNEDRRRWYDRAGKALFPFLATGLVAAAFVKPYGPLHLLLLIATLLALGWWGYVWFWRPAGYLGTAELRAVRSNRETQA